PYGKVTFLNAAWTTLGASAYSWIYLFQGGRWDSTSGLYGFRNRDLSPTLGRWLQVDPWGFGAGDMDFYPYEGDAPAQLGDPLGLAAPNVGHHWVTVQSLSKYSDFLSNEARWMGIGAYSGPLGGAHSVVNNVGHDVYNYELDNLFRDMLIRDGIAKEGKKIGKDGKKVLIGVKGKTMSGD